MMPYLTESYGNVGALYGFGHSLTHAIRKARQQVSTLFNCDSDHVIFTSGGSESNSAVFQGLKHKLAEDGKKHIIVSAVEHDSVLKAAKALTRDGFYITCVRPDENGVITPKAVEDAMCEDTGLVSVMFVNNETGAVNDVEGIGKVCHDHGILFHTDCVQAAGQYLIDVNKCYIDFASVSAHKIHGPKGVGALYLRNRDITPLICGGAEQEFGLRGGTENVAGIVGFGAAAELAVKNLCEDMISISTMKQQFYNALREVLTSLGIDNTILHVNGRSVVSQGKILNLRVDGVDAQTLVLMADAKGVCISAGSACCSHDINPSHVLTVMGLSKEQAASSVRISFSKYNREAEVIAAAERLAVCIEILLQGQKE